MAGPGGVASADREELPLSKAAEYLLEECRMVLPGMQALFGFQLIAVFNAGFDEKLHPAERQLHLLAIALIAIAIAIIMTPAAYHRQTGAQAVTKTFLTLSTRLLVASMVPLALGICVDFYLICRIVLKAALPAAGLAAVLFGGFMVLWFLLPRALRRNRQKT